MAFRPHCFVFDLPYSRFFQIVIVVLALHMQTGDISRLRKVKRWRSNDLHLSYLIVAFWYSWFRVPDSWYTKKQNCVHYSLLPFLIKLSCNWHHATGILHLASCVSRILRISY